MIGTMRSVLLAVILFCHCVYSAENEISLRTTKLKNEVIGLRLYQTNAQKDLDDQLTKLIDLLSYLPQYLLVPIASRLGFEFVIFWGIVVLSLASGFFHASRTQTIFSPQRKQVILSGCQFSVNSMVTYYTTLNYQHYGLLLDLGRTLLRLFKDYPVLKRRIKGAEEEANSLDDLVRMLKATEIYFHEDKVDDIRKILTLLGNKGVLLDDKRVIQSKKELDVLIPYILPFKDELDNFQDEFFETLKKDIKYQERVTKTLSGESNLMKYHFPHLVDKYFLYSGAYGIRNIESLDWKIINLAKALKKRLTQSFPPFMVRSKAYTQFRKTKALWTSVEEFIDLSPEKRRDSGDTIMNIKKAGGRALEPLSDVDLSNEEDILLLTRPAKKNAPSLEETKQLLEKIDLMIKDIPAQSKLMLRPSILARPTWSETYPTWPSKIASKRAVEIFESYKMVLPKVKYSVSNPKNISKKDALIFTLASVYNNPPKSNLDPSGHQVGHYSAKGMNPFLTSELLPLEWFGELQTKLDIVERKIHQLDDPSQTKLFVKELVNMGIQCNDEKYQGIGQMYDAYCVTTQKTDFKSRDTLDEELSKVLSQEKANALTTILNEKISSHYHYQKEANSYFNGTWNYHRHYLGLPPKPTQWDHFHFEIDPLEIVRRVSLSKIETALKKRLLVQLRTDKLGFLSNQFDMDDILIKALLYEKGFLLSTSFDEFSSIIRDYHKK